MDDEEALFDSGFDDTGPFRVSPESGGVSLEAALRDFGPAAIDDLIPRVRALARRLDAAHRAGIVHGALHPSKVIIEDDRTTLIAGKESTAPYAAPEVRDGYGPAPVSDQYSLAAITYEWLFGRPVPSHVHRTLDVRSMPGVDRAALTAALTRALAQDPDDRFPSCKEFCDAVAAAVIPELPLLANLEDFASEEEPREPAPIDDEPAPVDDVKLAADDVRPIADEPFRVEPDVDPVDSALSNPESAAVPSWNPSITAASTRTSEPPRFGPVALIFAVVVGGVFGFAAGYMAKPRALQGGTPQEMAAAPQAQPPTAAPAAKASETSEPGDARDASAKGKGTPASPVSPASPASPAASAAESAGRLLVRSTPSGASVSIDGVSRGVTPLALRSLDVGTRTVVIARRGYIPETRKVVITKERPARTLDVRLSAAAVAQAPPRPATPASLGKPAASTGVLAVESRPAGASVTINGRASGTTPLVLNDVAPGEYRILITMPGYREFATTVRVGAGERARAAASLTALVERINDMESTHVVSPPGFPGPFLRNGPTTSRSDEPLVEHE